VLNAAADNDNNFLQWSGVDGAGTHLFVYPVAGKKLWFKSRFLISDALLSKFVMGLQSTDTTPLAVADGLFFQKVKSSASVDFHSFTGSADSPASAVATIVANTNIDLGFFYDGVSTTYVFVNDVLAGRVSGTPTTAGLTVSFGIENGEAVAKFMTVDYIFVAVER